ncbi:phage antirepressor KilAC domain-containing protein [Streptomyces sp. NPDC006997]|uniref:phage antirepressor n=1 Tax=Streptomyces sp. NPDC006997 TaxID=3155356 RepID=UPI0033F16AF3
MTKHDDTVAARDLPGRPALPQLFRFPETGQPVRSVLVQGEPWFVGKDACDVVGISKYRDALAQLDEDERVSAPVDTPGGAQQMILVSEPGIYALMLISRSPRVKAFRRWLTHEVLPAIRRTGSYTAAVPQSLPEALRAYASEVEAREAAEARAAELEPAAAAWETLATAEGDYSLREAAQILSRDPRLQIGQNRLLQRMRELGWVDRKGQPYQKQVEAGRLVCRPRPYTHPHTGEPALSSQVRVTARGLAVLRDRLGGQQQATLPLAETSQPPGSN